MAWEQLWLNYKKKPTYGDEKYFETIYQMNNGEVISSAMEELIRAARAMFDIWPCVKKEESMGQGIVVALCEDASLGEEGYHIKHSKEQIVITANTENGILYGVFELLRQVNMGQSITKIDKKVIPSNPLRMINHWDNMGGSIERGYSGDSFFFENNKLVINERTKDYARLMASIGINASVINNVNVIDDARKLIAEEYLEDVAQIAKLFKSYGINLYISINYAAPINLGGLESADPFNEQVIAWWKEVVERIYQKIPYFGGFMVKADSEGQPGPFAYNRSHAEGANMLADLVLPYNGLIIWRCFVYNCKQDWRDDKIDRAKAAYDNFMPIDGEFRDNVILQIKNGPMDFQVREPISPLFGGLKNTHQMLEVQIAQEYTGQQIDVCYLVPMWKETLKFHTYIDSDFDTVGDIVSGRTYQDKNCGMAAVSNTGNDPNWTGSDLAAANLYGFGRLAFDTDLTADEIAREWAIQTFVSLPIVVENVVSILMNSWPTYENYTSPLGIGWMITPDLHYGPCIDGYEYDVWGTYHKADHLGIGVDRTSKGTGYAQQYNEPLASLYEKPETCPEELLLFFHRIPYQYKLKSQKTLIQHIYDSHFEGLESVEEMIQKWKELESYLDKKVYERTYERFCLQWENAHNWRDIVNSYFYRKSMIQDEKGRKIYK